MILSTFLLVLGLMINPSHAASETATEILHKALQNGATPASFTGIIQQLPPLTPQEIQTARSAINNSQHSAPSCYSNLDCFASCMQACNVTTCCENKILCIGSHCVGSLCAGTPSRAADFAALGCGSWCLYRKIWPGPSGTRHISVKNNTPNPLSMTVTTSRGNFYVSNVNKVTCTGSTKHGKLTCTFPGGASANFAVTQTCGVHACVNGKVWFTMKDPTTGKSSTQWTTFHQGQTSEYIHPYISQLNFPNFANKTIVSLGETTWTAENSD